MNKTLYIEEARRRVDAFGQIDAVGESQYAMECLDCEAWLRIGIDVFKFLTDVEEAMRLAIYRGKAPEGMTVDALTAMFEGFFNQWLITARQADRWIRQCESRGYVVDHKEAFFDCVSDAKLIVEFRDEEYLPDGLKPFRNRAISEIQNGTTAEFFPEQ